MKTSYFVQAIRRLIPSVLLTCATLGMVAVTQTARAQGNSPVGQWDLLMSGGGQQGIALLEFTEVPSSVPGCYLLQGFELLGSLPKRASDQTDRGGSNGDRGVNGDDGTPTITTNTYIVGFTEVYGEWSFDTKGNIIGFLSFIIEDSSTGDLSTNSVSFKGKVSGRAPNLRMSLVASSSYGKVSYRGLPLIPVTTPLGTDFDGSSWQGVKTQQKTMSQEFFTLTSTLVPNVYLINGSGPGYSYADGVCIVSRQNRIGFFIEENSGTTNFLSRASVGTLDKKRVQAKTKGSTFGNDTVFKFDAARMN